MRVEVRELGFTYPASVGGARALDEVSFCLATGRCLGVCGGPGAGKSTLARLLAGLLVPTAGSVVVGEAAPAAGHSPAASLVSLVGYLPQWPERQLFAETVGEDVAAGLGRERRRPRDWRERVARAMAAAGLEAGLAGRPVFDLSGGEARRAALAGVLVLDRPVLVLDEPTAGLDAAGRRETVALLARLKGEGRTLVVISHRPEDLLPAADDLLVLREGRALYAGPPAGALTAVGTGIPWPPVIETLLRLGRPPADPRAVLRDPSVACREVLGALGGAGSPSTPASRSRVPEPENR